MALLPSASLVIDDQAGAFAGGTGYLVIFACVEKNADTTPRVFASAKAALDTHGYSAGVDLLSMFIDQTRSPCILVGLPSATAGAVGTVDVTGVTGTSVVTVVAGTDGVLEEVNATATVVTGGTIGTAGIVIDLSLDGGRTTQRFRLGTANSYVIPFVGMTMHFATGTLIAGDKITWTSTPPMWDGAGITAARRALATQQKLARSWIVVGDLTSSALATDIVAEANNYETANQRFIVARAQVRDKLSSETKAQHVSAMDTMFSSIDGQKRIDLGLGRGRMFSPITGWSFRRPVQWAATCREYQHDVQIPTFRKSDGPLTNFDMTDGNGQVIEFDERTDGGALAARFTCARTYGNGPLGSFIALSLTRASEGSLLSRTHNMHVADVACTVTQAETENAIGQVLVLNDDGTATLASLQKIEERINSQLQIALLQQRVEGQRASKAVWTASRTDTLNVPGATLNGVLALELNGTLEQIATSVRVLTAG